MSNKTNKLVKIAMLSAVAFVVMLLETPTPFSTFLKLDLSDLVAVMGGFAFGPLAGLAIVFIKNALHLLMSQTAGIGEFSNFVIGGTFVYVASNIYRQVNCKTGGFNCGAKPFVLASLAMVAVAAFMNYFILIPLYAKVLGFSMEAVVAATNAVNTFVTDKFSFILFAIVPFNILKSLLVSVASYLLYPKLAFIIKKEIKTIAKA